MKKLSIGLAVAVLFGSAGVVACGLDQKDASDDATPMASKASTAMTPTKQAAATSAAKVTQKPGVFACAGSNCESVPPTASVAKAAVVACKGGDCN